MLGLGGKPLEQGIFDPYNLRGDQDVVQAEPASHNTDKGQSSRGHRQLALDNIRTSRRKGNHQDSALEVCLTSSVRPVLSQGSSRRGILQRNSLFLREGRIGVSEAFSDAAGEVGG